MVDKQVLIYQLISARAALDAALAVLTAAEQAEAQGCQHPEESRLDMSTMGHPKWRCRDCGLVKEG